MRWAVLLLVVLAFAGPVRATEFEVESLEQAVELHGVWRFRAGDNLRWADPTLSHGQWDNIRVPRDWRRQGHENLTGMAWYRARIQLDMNNPQVADRLHQLGIAMGKVHSAYELYVGGQLLGGAGRLPPDPLPVSDQKRIYSIPPDAVAEDGTLLVAVRVWRHPTLGRSSTSGLFEGSFAIGEVFDLTKLVWFSESVLLMLVIIYLGFGLYHLYLYARNRRLPEFLWFGLVACLVAVYTLEISQWKHVVGWLSDVPYMVHKKIEYSVIYILPALGLQLLACLLRVTPPKWFKFYQYGFVAFSGLALLVPGYNVLVYSLFYWQLYVIPGLVATLVLVVWFAARGNEEAQTMTLGWGVFLFCALNDIMVAQGAVANPRLLSIGFVAIFVSMAVSLANRFTRMYNHLDGEVQQRTIELERTNEKLVEAARLDTLTGLLNRRGFADAVEGEISRSARTGREFVVMMGDIDRFKVCNDRFGHACGDYVLQETARLLSEQLRDVDTIARWGGEEFIFLLPETSVEGGRILAEKLRVVLEHSHFTYEGNVLSLTITIGVAAFRRGMSLEDCLSRADAALYAGKQGGRNQVVVEDGQLSLGATDGLPSGI